MLTWFDALLVTLWAVVTVVGARRGLGGLLWGILGLAVCFFVNLVAPSGAVAGVLSLMLGLGAVFSARRLIRDPLSEPWHLGAGALGGFVLGGLLVATLALSLPIQPLGGGQQRYPSDELPLALSTGVGSSVLVTSLGSLWRHEASGLLRLMVVPDQARLTQP